MAKKVFIGVGHGGKDSGAIGLGGIYEKNINLGIATACQTELLRHGITVLMSRTKDEDDTLSEEIKEGNAFKADIAVDFHNNAGGGDGFEAYHELRGGISRTLAQNIEAEVKAIGQNSRGLKTRALKGNPRLDHFGFVRELKCPSILCEFAFVDTKDVYIVDTPTEQRIMGIAAAKGILKTLGIAWVEPVPIPQGYNHIVVYDLKAGAETQRAKADIEKTGWYNEVKEGRYKR